MLIFRSLLIRKIEKSAMLTCATLALINKSFPISMLIVWIISPGYMLIYGSLLIRKIEKSVLRISRSLALTNKSNPISMLIFWDNFPHDIFSTS